MKKKTFFIIDGSSCIYRAFHAIPPFTNSKGFPTNAIYGYIQTLKRLIKDHSPDFMAVAFDLKGPTIRHALYDEYKANRPAMPDDLAPQMERIREVTEAFNIPALSAVGYEADDILATLVTKYKDEDLKFVVVTTDKDMLQLVGGDVTVFNFAKNKEYFSADVVEKFGIEPELVTALLGLAGDTSDGIPGVPGIGVKTAAKLLNEYKSFENIFKNLENISGKKLKANLEEFKEQAEISKELATLHHKVPLGITLDALKRQDPDTAALEKLFTEFEFTKLLAGLVPLKVLVGGGGLEESEIFKTNITVVDSPRALTVVMKSLKGCANIALNLNWNEGSSRVPKSVVISTLEDSFFIPLGGSIEKAALAQNLEKLLFEKKLRVSTSNAKALFLYFLSFKIEPLALIFDVTLASYVLNPTASHNLEDLTLKYLGQRFPEVKDFDEKTKASMQCRAVLELSSVLDKKLNETDLEKLYLDMEAPLVEVLASMEFAGISVNKETLKKLSKEMEGVISTLETEIFQASGEEINLNSPKQLSELLFTRLGLKPIKKTKTGYSTDESVLTTLAKTHPVPASIIKFRQVSKLRATFVEGLLKLIDSSSSRLHTSFNQTVTATGRLSSSAPNLQNIPIKGDYAGIIRGAFEAPKGSVLLSADYSQIELRLVAHLSEDAVLIDSFKKNQDVHERTASEVFGIIPGLVTPEMRRRAKAINFGIIYGMGAHGLARELGVSMREAEEFIDSYFLHYEGVKDFIDKTINDAREVGYTETLFGRRRYIPELKASTHQVVKFGERVAVNSPVQGSAADMIKVAMIKVFDGLRTGGYSSRMLLQIHDELVLEVPLEELPKVEELVRDAMEGVLTLKVPIVVNLASGENWASAK
ncbi:MAG: DNA polymerase I [Deltaproteobacteria bacterium]|nr:DNA polymerase I [Deltaproteobacteria bacterium]